MTPKTDSVAVLRDPIAAELHRLGYGYDESTAESIACVVLRALSAQGEPDLWQYRARDPNDSMSRNWHLFAGKPNVEALSDRYEFRALYLHPAPPGADAVTEEEISWLAMEAASFIDNEYQHGRARPNAHRIREHLRAALAARTGKGEANGR